MVPCSGLQPFGVDVVRREGSEVRVNQSFCSCFRAPWPCCFLLAEQLEGSSGVAKGFAPESADELTLGASSPKLASVRDKSAWN